jgi:hypothetical protein
LHHFDSVLVAHKAVRVPGCPEQSISLSAHAKGAHQTAVDAIRRDGSGLRLQGSRQDPRRPPSWSGLAQRQPSQLALLSSRSPCATYCIHNITTGQSCLSYSCSLGGLEQIRERSPDVSKRFRSQCPPQGVHHSDAFSRTGSFPHLLGITSGKAPGNPGIAKTPRIAKTVEPKRGLHDRESPLPISRVVLLSRPPGFEESNGYREKAPAKETAGCRTCTNLFPTVVCFCSQSRHLKVCSIG